MSDRPLAVVLNLVPLTGTGGGVGVYMASLLEALAAREDVRVTAVTTRDEPPGLRQAPWASRVRWVRAPVRTGGPPLHLGAQFGLAPLVALARRADVLHSPANAGPVRVPGVPCVITLHDLIWFHAPEDWGPPAAVRAMHRTAVPTVRRADRVITGSHDTAEDLTRHLGLAPERLDVVHHGIRLRRTAPTAPGELRARLGLGDGPVVLCVAQKRAYKNQEVLVRALAGLPGAQLVCPGTRTSYEDELRELARAEGVAERLHLPPYVSDEDLEGLYGLARCVALPSRIEGFGLPVLEAMARGVPVACSDRTALPEVAGDAAVLFDPDDAEGVRATLARVLGDDELHAELARRGRARAATFTWDAAAELTVASYRRAASSRRTGTPPATG